MSAHEALERVELLNRCQQAIADLLTPGLDLQDQQLDRLAILMDFINQQHQAATEALRNSLLQTP